MNRKKIENSNKAIKKVTWFGMAINVILGIIKISTGIIAGSLALIADGIHSLSDLASDFAVLLGIKLSSRAPDKKHTYGHGRMETLSAFLIALTLITVGGVMIYKAAINITRENTSCPSRSAIVIATISVLLKEFLYQVTKKSCHEIRLQYALRKRMAP